MRILAGDTSTGVNTVALIEDGRVRVETYSECGRRHAERLMATVAFVLSEAGCTLADIDALAISNGPGSFTGLRVGVATWKGLALARGPDAPPLPLVAVPTLDAMTRLVPGRGVVVPMLDARMREVFASAYRVDGEGRSTLVPDAVLPPSEFLDALAPHLADSESVVFAGDGATLYRDTLLAEVPRATVAQPPCDMPRAGAVGLEALALLEAGAPATAAEVSPVYLRKSQAELARDARTGAEAGA
jgi:tRNA threonylcarbamoyladenosine biosynthesis protein TsaB